jgi:hypothetical protein
MRRIRPPAKVHFSRGVSYDVYRFKSDNLDGKCTKEDRAIYLREGMSAKDDETTLIHECVHIFDFEQEIGLTETQVLKLEKALVSWLRLNRKWLNHE